MSDLQKTTAAVTARRNFTTHGLSTHPLYEIWRSLFGDSNRRLWVGHDLAGVDPENWDQFVDPDFWSLTLFVQTMERRLAERPSSEHVLTRIDLDRGWFVSNLQWELRSRKSMRKKRRRRLLAADCASAVPSDGPCVCDYWLATHCPCDFAAARLTAHDVTATD